MKEWEIASKKVDVWLDNADSCPGLERLVMRVLSNWKGKTPVIYDSDLDQEDWLEAVFRRVSGSGVVKSPTDIL